MISGAGPVEVDIVFEDSKIFFEFTLDDEDLIRIAELNFDVGEKGVYVDIGNQDASIIHPDLICLSVVLLCNPFVGRELKINHPMSEQFHSQAQSVISRYKLIASPEVVEKIPAKSTVIRLLLLAEELIRPLHWPFCHETAFQSFYGEKKTLNPCIAQTLL